MEQTANRMEEALADATPEVKKKLEVAMKKLDDKVAATTKLILTIRNGLILKEMATSEVTKLKNYETKPTSLLPIHLFHYSVNFWLG